jgi:hypothetical protein
LWIVYVGLWSIEFYCCYLDIIVHIIAPINQFNMVTLVPYLSYRKFGNVPFVHFESN